MANDRNWVAAGIAGALLIPLLVFGLRLPYVIALAAGLIAFAGLAALLAPRKLFEGIDVSKVARGRLDLARKVLGDAEPELVKLSAAAAKIKDARIRGEVEHLAGTAKAILAGVEQNPERLSSVQRFLTYYLPAAGELAENYAVLEQKRSPDAARLEQANAVIGKLGEAFSHYADTLLESDLSGLDVELKLIDAAIKEDLNSAP
jgi:5-bromo-4-chloroindolyl phosphate hydrolysis protein